MHLRLHVAVFVLAIVIGGTGLLGQRREQTFFPDKSGIIEAIKIDRNSGEGWHLSVAEQKAFYGHLAELHELFLAQPVFKPPKGFMISGYARAEDKYARTGTPVRGSSRLRYIPYILQNDYNTGKPPAGKEPFSFIYLEEDVYLHVNDPTAALGSYEAGPFFPSATTPVLFQPHKIGERDGFPIYATSEGNYVSPLLVMTRSAKSVWVPLSQEGFLNILIKHHQARRAAKDSDYRSEEPIVNMQAALAKMSPQEKQRQAFYLEHYDYSPPLAAPGTPRAQPLVIPNPELFDPSLPRTAVQLIIVQFHAAWNLKDPQPEQFGNFMNVRQAQTLDTSNWQAISAILDERP